MARTFNNGIGMVVIVSPSSASAALDALRKAGNADVYHIGKVTSNPGVEIENIHVWATM